MGKQRAKKVKKNVPTGVVHIKTTFNNTIVSIADPQGNIVCWASSGTAGFPGSRKSTPFAAQLAAEQAGQKAVRVGMKDVEVKVNGPGAGRESALTGLQSTGLSITAISDVTPLPHNGCRPRKRRRG